jgi:DNA polymerase III alpha subunit (gram-positive type)
MIYWQVIDLETTGLSANNDEIAELALITCRNIEIINIHHQFYQVSKMGEKAAQVNGLSISQLRGWPIFSSNKNITLLQDLIKYPLFAHNASFDAGFLIAKNVIKDNYPVIDTVKLCKKSDKKLIDNKLQTWLTYCGFNNGIPHQALSDCFGLTRLIIYNGWQIYARN